MPCMSPHFYEHEKNMTVKRTAAQAYLQVLQELSETISIRVTQNKPEPRRISGGCLLYDMNFKRVTSDGTTKTP